MINKVKAEMYCSQPIELIENYDKAVADTTQTWHCHHIWETMLGYSKEELIEMDEYYGIPACNLIFLTNSEHRTLHNTGLKRSEETKTKMSKSHINGKKSKPVLQFTTSGVFVKEYPSTMEVQRQTGFKQPNIYYCCCGKLKTAKGFIWKFKR